MENAEQKNVLCVDLDYTLISTDILAEQVIRFIKKNPLKLFIIFIWLFKSKQNLKKRLYELTKNESSNLPYRKEVLDFLSNAKNNNHKIVLVTASLQPIAERVQSELNLFDEVYGSNNDHNLKGKNKAKFLAQKFGVKNFDYIGDSISDFPIWAVAQKAYLVSNSNLLNFLVKNKKNFAGNLLSQRTKLRDFFKLIRLHQWIKNLLIFLPLLLAHQFENLVAIQNSILAFFAFSFLASSLYIFNDIVDCENDRNHPLKRNRPIAKGLFSLYTGFFIGLSVLITSLLIAFFIGVNFFIVCAFYLVLNIIYSFWVKQIAVVDIFLLSLFYVIRLYAGSEATSIPISNWLLAFSMFFFLSLATFKRYSDLKLSFTQNNNLNSPYSRDSLNFFQTFGISSSFASVIVFILYINSEKVFSLYKHPSFLWLDAFLLLLWMMVIWNLATKSKVEYDPILVSVKNPYLVLLEVIMIVVWLMAFAL
ncbi:MAG: putative membrane protein [Candidatus Kapaibacterium sp.]|nr:MAG: putative membrane protein [Candidatus Kapabacteria bacterium]